jgi:hypothetical protein
LIDLLFSHYSHKQHTHYGLTPTLRSFTTILSRHITLVSRNSLLHIYTHTMLASTLLSVLPVLVLVASVSAGPVHKKRACARPSVSASASASASISESASITISSAIESATSINTAIFAPASTDASASLEPTSTVESASASASESVSASASEEASSTSASAEPAQTSAASSSDAETFVKLHNDFRAQYGMYSIQLSSEMS